MKNVKKIFYTIMKKKISIFAFLAEMNQYYNVGGH